MQVRFAGVTASDTREDPLLVTELDLGGMSVRSQDSANLNDHGYTPGRDFAGENSVKFVLWSNRDNYRQGVSELNRFLVAWREAIFNSKTGQLVPLEYRHDNEGPWQTIYGSPDHSSNSQIDELSHHGYSIADFEFRQHLPLTYGPEFQSTLSHGEQINFGLSEGPVIPVIRFYGPFTDPVLQLGDTRVGLRGTADADDYWDVDPFTRTVTDRYGRNNPARADRLTVLSRIEVKPDLYTVDLTSSPEVRITWRPSAFNKYEGGTLVEYRWLGSEHFSESVKMIDGNTVARNLISNPSFELSTSGVTRSNAEVEVIPRGDLFPWLDAGEYALHVTPNDPTSSFYIGQNFWEASPDKWYAFRASIFTLEAGDRMRIFIQFRDEGTTLSKAVLDDLYIPEGGRDFTFAAKAPPNTNSVLALIWPHGYEGTFITDGLMVAEGSSEAEAYAQVQEYFDGDTPDYIIREDS